VDVDVDVSLAFETGEERSIAMQVSELLG